MPEVSDDVFKPPVDHARFLDDGFQPAPRRPASPASVMPEGGAFIEVFEERHHSLFERPRLRGFQVAVAQSGELFSISRFHFPGMTQPVVTGSGQPVVAAGFELFILAPPDLIDGL